MCGRVVVDYDELIPAAHGTELAAWITGTPAGAASSWNLKPTQRIPVAFTDPTGGERRFDTAHWSLVPTWSKNLKLKFPTFNARIETVAEKPTFRAAVQSRRCAIPVSAFYEWTGPKGGRIPHAIFGPRPLLPLAGLLSWWRDPSAAPDAHATADRAEWILTATILTRSAAGRMADLHDRMPVFLAGELTADWLDPGTPGDPLLLDAVAEAAVPISEQLRVHRVAPLRGDGPQLLDAV